MRIMNIMKIINIISIMNIMNMMNIVNNMKIMNIQRGLVVKMGEVLPVSLHRPVPRGGVNCQSGSRRPQEQYWSQQQTHHKGDRCKHQDSNFRTSAHQAEAEVGSDDRG